MELIAYFRILARWWWLLVIAASLTGGVSYVLGRAQDPLYRAEVKIFVGSYLQNPDPQYDEIYTGQNLALTYAKLVTVRPILEATVEAVGLEMEPAKLAEEITTTPDTDTSILTITVTDRNPLVAADIANELSNQLILNSPTNLTVEDEERRQIIETELAALGEQIAETRAEIEQLNEQIEVSSDPQQSAVLRDRREILVSRIAQWQQSIADLSYSLNTFSQRSNTLRVVEPALVPIDPIGSGIFQRTLLAIFIGLVLAVGLALLLDYLDDTFREPREVREVLGIPVLAGIVKFGGRRDGYKDMLVTLKAPNSSPVEGYRALRTNLLYGFEEGSHKRLIVTSAQVSEGKSVTAANLAVSLARAEVNVVLIDTDLYHPQVHNILGLDNRVGLSNLFDIPMRSTQLIPTEYLSELLKLTELPYLRAITSGPLPSNPAELLGMPHVPSLCRSLEETLGVEMIIFDTPPVLSVIDTTTLASNIDASVILVIKANRTRRDGILRVLDQFTQVGVSVIGTVLNNITRQTDGYYYYYYTYGRYRENEPEAKRSGAR